MREVFLDAFSWMDEFLHNFRARSFLWLVNQCLQLGFRRLRKAIVTPKMMIYLFVIYLTLLKAMDSKATIWPWIVVKDVQGFLQDYSGMYRGALQRAQDYLKPPARRENTIDYHYSLLAKVVAHTFSSGKRLAKHSRVSNPSLYFTVTALKPGRTKVFPVENLQKRKFTILEIVE